MEAISDKTIVTAFSQKTNYDIKKKKLVFFLLTMSQDL